MSATPARDTSAVHRRPGRPGSSAGEDGRQRLLQAAEDVFASQGFEPASLRAIADLAGLDPALVSHHFGSKQRLWHAAVDAVAERQKPLLPVLQGIVDAPSPLLQRVHDAVDFFIDLADQQRALFRFIQRELGHSGPRLHYLTERLVQPCYAICAPLWQQAIEQRVLLSPHPAVFYFLLLGALSTTLGAVPMIAQLAGEEVDRQAILHSLRLILQGHFQDALP